jgi:hypothetical protein
MSPSEIKACYRLYAAHCLEIAQRLSDRGAKIALLNMAQTWIALADQIEKAKGASTSARRSRSCNLCHQRNIVESAGCVCRTNANFE